MFEAMEPSRTPTSGLKTQATQSIPHIYFGLVLIVRMMAKKLALLNKRELSKIKEIITARLTLDPIFRK